MHRKVHSETSAPPRAVVVNRVSPPRPRVRRRAPQRDDGRRPPPLVPMLTEEEADIVARAGIDPLRYGALRAPGGCGRGSRYAAACRA